MVRSGGGAVYCMQYFTKDEYVEQLPRCAACLHDFDLYQYPVAFLCKHLYCSQCLKRLKDSGEVYRCLYDGVLTPVSATHSDIGFYNKVDYFKRFVLSRAEVSADVIRQFDQIKKDVNYKLVACRNMLDRDECALASKCPYDHSLKSIGVARKFRDADVGTCWECKVCMLTVARRLKKCPVCDAAQEEEQSPSLQNSPLLRGVYQGQTESRRERPPDSSEGVQDGPRPVRASGKPTNPTLDLSVIAEEEKETRRQKLAQKKGKKSANPVAEDGSQGGDDSQQGDDPVKTTEDQQNTKDVPVTKPSSCCTLQ